MNVHSSRWIGVALVLGAVACARAVGGAHGGGGGGGASVGDLGQGDDGDLGVGGSGGGGAGGSGGGGAGASGGGGAGGSGGGGGGGGAGGSGGGGAGGSGGGGGGGVISGGPCASGAAGATAIRVHWSNAAGSATVGYDAFGMPDRSRQTVGAYGYQIGFVPQFVDPYLGAGGLLLDGDDFVDIELSAAGVASISSATLALYGRSYDTSASGSFSWQSASDSGATAPDFVSNVAPYQWYRADLGASIAPGDAGVLVRVKAGPSSGALVVHALEICLVSP